MCAIEPKGPLRAARLQLLICSLVLVAFGGCTQAPTPVVQVITGETMGTTYSVKIVPTQAMPALDVIAEKLAAELVSVNDQMSTYLASSELSRFNDQQSTEWFSVSAETAAVASLALEVHSLTEGAFDVTVGPLVDLWGFGPTRRAEVTPSKAEITDLLQVVGSDKLEVRLHPPALRKKVLGLRVDLSAIAKGHGVDRLAELLDELQVEAYFVEIGGEIRTRGKRLDGRAWQVGIERPMEGERAVQAIIALSDRSLATSGDYRNFFEQEGRRVNHFIDPRTGYPVTSQVASVSVIADNCALADALATGLMAAGYAEGLRLAERNEWAVMLIARTGEALEVVSTPQFESLSPQSLSAPAGSEQ